MDAMEWIGFLRAINLGATRKFPKAAIVAAVEAAGGIAVETYINTGNIRFTHELTERAQVELVLEKAFEEAAGFAVPTICVTPAELVGIASFAQGLQHDGLHYVSVLKDDPSTEAIEVLAGQARDPERVYVEGRGVHLLLGADYHTAKLSNAAVEKVLGVATNRNVRVITELARRWG
jgi:uncharacterized protein (DUF1697 family)